MTQGIFLKPIRNKFIDDFINDVANTATSYYITFGKYDTWPVEYDAFGNILSDDYTPPEANASIKTSTYDVFRNMLYGKQIFDKNIGYVISKNSWAANTVYDFYDDQDPNLYNKNFVVVNSSNRVYKCLFNNYGAKSTVEPQDFNPNGDFVTLPDGYKWKYMCTVSSADAIKFSSSKFVPVQQDLLVRQYAANGAIHVITVDNSGTNYPYANSTVISRITPTIIQVSPIGTDSIPGIYTSSTFYVYAGTGNNFISTIDDYVVNTTGNFIVTNSVTPLLDTTSKFKVGPTVEVVGDGTGVKAFAYVEPVANSVYDVEVIDIGSSYTQATVNFIANTLFLGTGGGAAARAIISPPGGHGYSTLSELGVDTLSISVEIADPQDDLPNWATYRQIALLYNPKDSATGNTFLDNYFKQYTTLTYSFYAGSFAPGATIQGLLSGASGNVIYSDASNVYLTDVKGAFAPYETILEPISGATTTVASINNGQLKSYSGDLFYYKNIEPVTRYPNSKEQVKIYFKV